MSNKNPISALGDSTRWSIVSILSAQPSSVAEIAQQLPVTRPAVSQHLQVLKGMGLVTLRHVGTRNIYQLDPGGFATLRNQLDSLWQIALEQFKRTAEESLPSSMKGKSDEAGQDDK